MIFFKNYIKNKISEINNIVFGIIGSDMMDEKTEMKYLYELDTNDIILSLLASRCSQYLAVCEEKKTEISNVFLLGNRSTTMILRDEVEEFLDNMIKEECYSYNVAVEKIYSDRSLDDHNDQILRYVYEYTIEELVDELKHRGEFTIAYKKTKNSKTIITTSCENDFEEYQDYVVDAIDFIVEEMDQVNEDDSYWWLNDIC